jgi:exodeoxyribonuclease VII large subunit
VAQRIDDLAERLPNALNARAAQVALRLTNAGSRLRPALLTARLERSSERLAGASARLAPALARPLNADAQKLTRIGAGLRPFLIESRLATASARLAQATRMLDSLSPLAVLARGYAIVTGPDGHVVASAGAAAAKPSLTIRFADGETPVFTSKPIGPVPPQGSLF